MDGRQQPHRSQAGAAVLFPVWASRVMHSAAALGLLGGAVTEERAHHLARPPAAAAAHPGDRVPAG